MAPRNRKTEPKDDPQTDETAKYTGPTLDDASTLLMQIEPADLAGFAHLGETLEAVAKSGMLAVDALEQVRAAAALVADLVSGKTTDGEDALIEASRLLEAAALSQEMGERKLRPSAAQPKQPAPPAAKPAPPAPPVEIVKAAPSPEKRPAPAAATAVVAESAPVEDHLPPDADPDLLGEFVNESRELLEGAEGAMLALESNPDDSEAVNRVFRAFHTIKGTSGFLGLTRTTELAHHAESLLSRIRNNEIRFAGGYADLSLRSVDMLKVLVQGVVEALDSRPMMIPAGWEELKGILSNPEASGISEKASLPVSAAPRVQAAPAAPGPCESDPEELETEAEPERAQEAESAQVTGGTPAPAAQAQKSAAQQFAKQDSKLDTSVRVSTTRLDRLIDMVGELVIAQSMVAQDRTLLQESCHELLRKVTHAGKIVRELQDLSMSMRMVPLRATFQKMHRLVRDLAHKSGKNVNLVAEDGDTEIDRHMVDIINDLLVHMVRNSVDHGIEPPEARTQAGKDPTGTVRLTAFHSGGTVVVEIKDDGRGLDREKIIRKAMQQGLIDSDKMISDSEAYNLIFAPGFSTAETVTDISGRGVGMDVVRRGVEALHGRIDVTTAMGQGSSFSVRLPLTLAITDGMLVRVGPDRYIIPTVNIHVSFRPKAEQISTIAGRGEMVLLRGELMPIFRLHQLFGANGAIEDFTHGLLVVVGDGERRCALLVDELLGQQQFVAKSLGDGVGKIQGVSGGAILGDGRVGLILDPAEITALARQEGLGWDGSRGLGRPAA
jgi:two-component system, chemotaxis family, sensor kinase CheA